MNLSKYQKFEAVTIDRGKIKNAKYNPRTIGEDEKKALKKSLKTFGLVDTLIWNVRTGNLVGGHQRINQLDELEKSQDYLITVSQIDVDEKTEKELNIALNNSNLQGQFDVDMLKELFSEINVENTGFTEYDMSFFGIDEDLAKTKEIKEITNTEENIKAIKEAKARAKEKTESTAENYVVLTFTTTASKGIFMEKIGFPADDRYIKGEVLEKKLNL